jgi:hypothetical protein
MLHTGDRDSPLEGLVCVNCAIRFAKVDVSRVCRAATAKWVLAEVTSLRFIGHLMALSSSSPSPSDTRAIWTLRAMSNKTPLSCYRPKFIDAAQPRSVPRPCLLRVNAKHDTNILVVCLVTPHSACALRTADETEFDPDEPPMAGTATEQLHYSNVAMARVPRFRRIAKSSVASGATSL